MTEAHDPGDYWWASPLRLITAVAAACMLSAAVQDARASDAHA